jgi:hypothetical protein
MFDVTATATGCQTAVRRWFRSGTGSDKIALSSLDLSLKPFGRPAKVDRRCPVLIVEPIPH